MTKAAEHAVPFQAEGVESHGAMRAGKVAKLNIDAGFGYVADDDGLYYFLFVAGHALPRTALGRLSIGSRVRFRTSAQGRVDQLVELRA